MCTRLAAVVLVAVCLLSPASVQAVDFSAEFIDSTDNHFDLSRWLDKVYGFMPMFSLITEPAVGFGIAGGIVFIHRPEADRGKPLTTPPSMSVLMGFYTENGSWGTGAFHQGYWRKDTIRYQGGLMYTSPNLTVYPPSLDGLGIGFNIKGGMFLQRIEFRVKGAPVFLGGRYIYFNNDITFDIPGSYPGNEDGLNSSIGSLGPLASFDTRNNVFTTNTGMYAQVIFDIYDEIFGSDFDFTKTKAYWLGWKPAGDFVLGLRLDGRSVNGDVPFYSLPSVKLRGIPAMRYQGEYVVVAETEERWNFARRWALDGFVGVGKAVPDGTSFGDAEAVWAGGGGFRYLLARNYQLFAGIDIARGPEDWAIYIVTGQWWNSL